jgi:hypothetical protein
MEALQTEIRNDTLQIVEGEFQRVAPTLKAKPLVSAVIGGFTEIFRARTKIQSVRAVITRFSYRGETEYLPGAISMDTSHTNEWKYILNMRQVTTFFGEMITI